MEGERTAAEPAAETTTITARDPAPAGSGSVRSAFGRLSPTAVLRLQRAAGNAAVVTIAEAAARLRSERESRPGSPTAPGVRFRVPKPDELKRLYFGGWARHDIQHIHLTGDVAEVKDLKQSIITLIHEAAHLAHPDVDDLGYYKSPGFEAMPDAKKVCNAAHYEELPARNLGVSAFATTTFTPGVKATGGKVTFEDEVRRVASEYLRKAWDAAVDAHQFVRETAKAIINDPAGKHFDSHKASLLEVSKMEQLTIHQQVPAPSTVTTLDAVLSEGVAHGTRRIQGKLKAQSVPATKNKKVAVKALIDGAINDYGALLGNAADDRKLMDWLVKHYRKGF